MGTDHQHRVCTYDEAERAIRAHDVIYLNECFCRGPAKAGEAAWEYCGHDVNTCMGFHEPKSEEMTFNYTVIDQAKALDIFEKWKQDGHLFRFMEDEEWICSCCSCGCGFFRDKDGNRTKDTCEKSPYIEKTDTDACTLCADCIPVCAYDARRITGGEMIITSEDCYGCAACEYVCPEKAIAMAPRSSQAQP